MICKPLTLHINTGSNLRSTVLLSNTSAGHKERWNTNFYLTFCLFLPELPGFYFDPEKNRYFRLLPGHNNCNPLTTEQLREKDREKQRNKMLAEDETPRKASLLHIFLIQKKVFVFVVVLERKAYQTCCRKFCSVVDCMKACWPWQLPARSLYIGHYSSCHGQHAFM